MPDWIAEPDDLSDFTMDVHTGPEGSTPGDRSKSVYWIGEGPGVVVMPEMPGLTPDVARFARRVAEAGFTCAVPSLFGEPGRPGSNTYVARSMVKGCVSSEFVAFATGTTSPVTGWVRSLVAETHRRCGGSGVGVVGMCFTGGFVLGVLVEESAVVGVMSQPSLPLPVGGSRKRDLGIGDDDLAAVKARVLADDACVIGLRFTGDPLVPGERFERLRAEFGDAFIGVEIDSTKGNADGFPKDAHSVLTTEQRPAPNPTADAYELVIDHFRRRLPSAG